VFIKNSVFCQKLNKDFRGHPNWEQLALFAGRENSKVLKSCKKCSDQFAPTLCRYTLHNMMIPKSQANQASGCGDKANPNCLG